MYADATVVATFERNGYCVTADCKLKYSVTCLVLTRVFKGNFLSIALRIPTAHDFRVISAST